MSELTTAQKKIFSSALKVAKRYGRTEEEQKLLTNKIKDLQDIVRTLPNVDERVKAIEQIKTINRKKTFDSVKIALDSVFSKMEGAGAVMDEEEKPEMKPTTPPATLPTQPKSEEKSPPKPRLRKPKPKPEPPKEPKPTTPKAQEVRKQTMPESPKKFTATKSQVDELEKKLAVADSKPATPPKAKQTKPDKPMPKKSPEKQEKAKPPPELSTDMPTPPPTPTETSQKQQIKKKVEAIPEDPLPTRVDLIPPERLSSEDKSVEQLKSDIDYFYKNFAEKLKRIKKTKSNNINVLKRFHKRIVALLRGDKAEKEEKKNIGIVIKGSDYIKDKLKEIILENNINGLSAKDLLINIQADPTKQQTDAGSYEFKTNKASGKTYAQGEPVFRYQLTEDPEQVVKQQETYKKPKARIPTPKTMYRGLEVTAKKQVAANPFLNARQPKIRLKSLY